MLLSNGTAVPTQVDILGDRTPMLSNPSYYNSTSLALLGSFQAFSELYRRQLWVGIVIRKLAGATGRMPFEVKLQGRNGIELEQGNMMALLERPNPQMSGVKMWKWVSSTFDIYGESFLMKIRDMTGRVRELHPVHPANVIIRRNQDQNSPEYGNLEYIVSTGSIFGQLVPAIPARDMVAFTTYNPENLTRGLSNLEGLRATLLNEDAARRATAAFWTNGARPSTIVTVPKTMSDIAYNRLKQSWNSTQAGADNAGSTPILEDGATAVMNSLNLEEMQYIDSRKLNREEVASAYDVPAPVIGILDHATFSNITEQLRSMYRDTMAPRFVDFESVINHQLLPDFYPFDEAFTRFNMDEVLRGDFETRATAINGLVVNGVMKPSEARPLFGLDDAGAVADVLYANAALVPLGSVPRVTPATDTSGQPIPVPMPQAQPLALEAGKSVRPVSLRSIAGRLSRVKDNKTATRAKLVDEHKKELSAFFDRQHAAVKDAMSKKSTGIFDPSDWNDELAGILHPLAVATTQAIGTKTATDLGGTYDGDRIDPWLQKNAKQSAANINQATATKLDARILAGADDEDYDEETDVDDFFDEQKTSRADEIATTAVAMLAGLASLVGAEQSGAATKTWSVTSGNPRASHAAMDGETVALGEQFSNGMDGPGDFNGGADEVAGCTCELTFNLPDDS